MSNTIKTSNYLSVIHPLTSKMNIKFSKYTRSRIQPAGSVSKNNFSKNARKSFNRSLTLRGLSIEKEKSKKSKKNKKKDKK